MPFTLTRDRLITHLALAGLTAFAYFLATLYAPTAFLPYRMTISMGYLSLLLMGVTLAIGTLNLLFARRNPVNIFVRRDIGIWAGITGILHVLYAMTINNRDDLLANFFRWTPDGYKLMTGTRGTSNYVGLVATLILLMLLATSNHYFLRRFKGKKWKTIQRWNYALIVLTVIHTLLYQEISRREGYFYTLTVIGIGFVVVAQVVGVGMTLYRRTHHRRTGNVLSH
ncbi:MAG: ferric reductase-like transmembrane domain-containing protein [Aggregatilineales bacterium]